MRDPLVDIVASVVSTACSSYLLLHSYPHLRGARPALNQTLLRWFELGKPLSPKHRSYFDVLVLAVIFVAVEYAATSALVDAIRTVSVISALFWALHFIAVAACVAFLWRVKPETTAI